LHCSISYFALQRKLYCLSAGFRSAERQLGGSLAALPSTLAIPESSRGADLVTFQRIIVWPDGHKEIEGVTPKQLPKPDKEPDESA